MNATHVGGAALLCIARHGETEWNRLGILQGWLDVTINDLGRSQARAMAQGFVDEGFCAVWSSTLVRAHETAEIIAKQLKLPAPHCHAGLKERNFGAIQGIPKTELAELNPVMMEQILRRNPQAAFVGGESMDEFADRILAALRDIGARHSGEQVLVITHGWVLDVVLRHINGLPRNTILNEKPKNGQCIWVAATEHKITAAGS